MGEDGREETRGVAKAKEGDVVRREAFHNIVDAEVAWAADEDAWVVGEELEDQFDKGVGFACARGTFGRS